MRFLWRRKGHNLFKSLQRSSSFILILWTHYFLILASPGVRIREPVRAIDEAGPVHLPHEHLEPNDGVDDDDEEDEEGDVEQRDHGHQDGVQHHLQTWGQGKKQHFYYLN